MFDCIVEGFLNNTIDVQFLVFRKRKQKGGRVVDGTGLENQRTKVPQVRILSLPPNK